MENQSNQNQNQLTVEEKNILTYYNSAYMKERERFNNVFGLLEEDKSSTFAVQEQQSTANNQVPPAQNYHNYVPLKKYKSLRRRKNFYALVSILGIACTIALLLERFGVFKLPF